MRGTALTFLVLIGGCAVYPTSRTFYEPNPADGQPKNQSSCGYVNTRDSLKRMVDGIEISISPAEENIGRRPPATLSTFISFTYRNADVRIDPSKLNVTDENGHLYQGQVLQLHTEPTRRVDGAFTWTIVRLLYPEPAGRSGNLTYTFGPGSITVDGVQIAISPFRFTLVTKRDVYYGSINC